MKPKPFALKRLALTLMLALVVVVPLQAQPADAVARIREEGLERSQIMRFLHHLTDRYGPRLTGSPQLMASGEWALETLTDLGLQNAKAEPWDWGRPGWENVRLSVHLTAPVQDALVAEALAWTPSTNGVVKTAAVHLNPPANPTQADLDQFLDAIRADVAGKVVLVGTPGSAPLMEFPLRRDDAEVRAEFEPTNTASGGNRGYRPPTSSRPEGALSAREVDQQVEAFLKEAGAAVRVNPARMEHGLIRAFANRTYNPADVVPTLVMRDEDFGRITRLLADAVPVEVEVEIVNRDYPANTTQYNYTADIVGTERPDEVVIIGGHLDSWHAATGATDNAAGVAIMMEAARILKAAGLAPRRTIRVALWTGEEQGLLGSQAYVAQQFGSFEAPKPAYDKFGGYINVDSGTGKLRGGSVFGPVEAAQVVERILAPLEDLGVAGARPTFSRGLGGSDHTSFNQAGLPGIGMGQDPIRYFSHTWHTNVDTYERILEDDVKQAAVVVATLAYGLAMEEALLPRFQGEEMPALPPGTN